MNAVSTPRVRRVLILPPHRSRHWHQWLPEQRGSFAAGSVDLDLGDWTMGTRELSELLEALSGIRPIDKGEIRIKDVTVKTTIVGGEIVYEAD